MIALRGGKNTPHWGAVFNSYFISIFAGNHNASHDNTAYPIGLCLHYSNYAVFCASEIYGSF